MLALCFCLLFFLHLFGLHCCFFACFTELLLVLLLEIRNMIWMDTYSLYQKRAIEMKFAVLNKKGAALPCPIYSAIFRLLVGPLPYLANASLNLQKENHDVKENNIRKQTLIFHFLSKCGVLCYHCDRIVAFAVLPNP